MPLVFVAFGKPPSNGPRTIVRLVSNFGFLAYFIYSGFIADNLNAYFAQLEWSFILPDPAASSIDDAR
jgi:hypothetical protein